MDKDGFRAMLLQRNTPVEKLNSAIQLAERFEQFAQSKGGLTPQNAWAFAKVLIEQSENTEENLIFLARYSYFLKNYPVFVAFIELLDGAEAQENLYKKVGSRHGEALRDEVFSGIGLAPLGIPTPEKPGFMQPVVARLEAALGTEGCRSILADSLRDLPDEYYAGERELFLSCNDIDEYLAHKKDRFVGQLEACLREGRPFFTQIITQEVVDFVRSQPEMGGGQRDGSIVYETKIPFDTARYLQETDPLMKHYYYCHCPWAREAVKSGDPVSPLFCNCSAGFHKRPWEVALGKPIQAEVLESVLRGDSRCRFSIHLPVEGA